MRSRVSRKSLFGVAAFAALVVAGCSDEVGPAPANRPVQPVPNVNFAQQGLAESDYIVQLKTFSSMPSIATAVVAAGGTVDRAFPEIGVMDVSGLSGAQLQVINRATGAFSSYWPDRELQWVPTAQQMGASGAGDAEDGVGSTGTNQSTASFFNSFQWGMKIIQAPAAWAASPGGSGKTVCILDSGIDSGHLDLAGGRVVTEVSVNTNTSDPRNQSPVDYNLHGTFVSSIVSSNGIGVASVAPDAKICSIKVLGTTGSGSFGDVIAGIMLAANMHADVINMSLGAYFDIRAPGGVALVQALQAAVDYAIAQGVVVVAASGNNGVNLDTDQGDILSVPAQIKGVISVGATGPTGQQNFDALASYSNYGGVTGIALVAPGGGGAPVFQQDLIIGACSRFAVGFNCGSGRSYLISNGTSFASPHVAGAAAVLRSFFPTPVRPNTIRRCLVQNTDVIGPSATFGAGRLNVAKALTCHP